jgi:hypothetical protein
MTDTHTGDRPLSLGRITAGYIGLHKKNVSDRLCVPDVHSDAGLVGANRSPDVPELELVG